MENFVERNSKVLSLFVIFILFFSLYTISNNVFADEITTIQDDTYKYTIIDDNSVSLTGPIDKTTLDDKDIVIPSEVQGKKVVEIGSRAFYRCKMKSIIIPDTVLEIKSTAFGRCSKAEEIQLPETIKIIGDSAFSDCASLKTINLPNSITTIGNAAFSACASLKTINLPNSITEIPKNLFSSSDGLETIEIPEGVTSIGNSAFSDCKSLKEVTIPKSITSNSMEYPELVFIHCDALKTIKGYKGTYARKMSIILGCKFVALDAAEGEKELQIKFDPDNGKEIITQPIYEGEVLDYSPYQFNEKEGYTFVGWYADTDDITTEYKNNATYTSDITYKAKWAHFESLGAQVKLDKSGIRFGTKLYDDGDKILEKGTVMLPIKLFDTSKIWLVTLDLPKVAQSIGRVNYEVNEEENYVVYLGTLVNIPESQRDTSIRASAYVKYEDKAGNKYIAYDGFVDVSINKLVKSNS